MARRPTLASASALDLHLSGSQQQQQEQQPPMAAAAGGAGGKHHHDDAAVAAAAAAAAADDHDHASHDHGHGHHDDHHQRACLLPAETYQHMVLAGAAKPGRTLLAEVVLGVLAGMAISLGFSTCLLAAGQLSKAFRDAQPGAFALLFGAYGFPVGLTMCVINGLSLFTSNVAYMAVALMERRASLRGAAYILCCSYLANLAGALLVVGLMLAGGVFEGHKAAFPIELAGLKTSHPFGATFAKGVLCNFMVCVAVWQGNAAQDVTGKLLGVWFPISAFVTMGFEHCIANMYLVPLAMALGAPISPRAFLVSNLIPATLGNLVGGGVFVGAAFGLAFGSCGDALSGAARGALTHCRGAPAAAALPITAAGGGAPHKAAAAAAAVLANAGGGGGSSSSSDGGLADDDSAAAAHGGGGGGGGGAAAASNTTAAAATSAGFVARHCPPAGI